ncbi:helix-turn-helix transcriptional regulator [Mitsuokella jalaludinii]|uniref:helix-turn-helix transcriptional regulator n=1 Tax=Mitsuokella jalaludinii TaxID=187979 RepID=UPI0020D0A392|nr:helix-turn-helix transcriptional regulator [Mitsuokella jalaludinii]MCQ1533544.1 PadR family transcriptional regulator [Mitsuokella jalaludinii]
MEVIFFKSSVAKVIGVTGAIILNNLHYWINHNEANEKNFFDGCYWTYNSIKAFCEQFPFLSRNSITRALSKLEKDGYIKTGFHNENSWDRTKWYALTDKGYALVGKPVSTGDTPKDNDAFTQKQKCSFTQSKKCSFTQKQKSTNKQINTDREIQHSNNNNDPFCTGSPALDDALHGFDEMRKKLRKPLTDRAKRLTLGKLEKLAPGNEEMQIAILDQSVENSWQGVYRLKTEDWKGNRGDEMPRQYREAEKALEMIKQYEEDGGGEDDEGFEWPDSLKDH